MLKDLKNQQMNDDEYSFEFIEEDFTKIGDHGLQKKGTNTSNQSKEGKQIDIMATDIEINNSERDQEPRLLLTMKKQKSRSNPIADDSDSKAMEFGLFSESNIM